MPSPPVHPYLRPRSSERKVPPKTPKGELANDRLGVESGDEGVDTFSRPEWHVWGEDDPPVVSISRQSLQSGFGSLEVSVMEVLGSSNAFPSLARMCRASRRAPVSSALCMTSSYVTPSLLVLSRLILFRRITAVHSPPTTSPHTLTNPFPYQLQPSPTTAQTNKKQQTAGNHRPKTNRKKNSPPNHRPHPPPSQSRHAFHPLQPQQDSSNTRAKQITAYRGGTGAAEQSRVEQISQELSAWSFVESHTNTQTKLEIKT
ncbi:hypothetical protein P153DRAFT_355752 [Dothidotthia symphoricarpi CBS 119687]|uniref:Uncharacterized protein n=1 Tax=Dothidotthia symphoricarpi CBS 119687 TaxID=1392245 RepID=A0A6A6AGM2_9PLEO|nr:uncharacterized protein P153DRAFT_355752 [Dothidotthia symphoricarpi CBS 119687]KAF2130950.1 hypothetical protein P153DRAFT_355752 [Dothidotthia symphoricarpi CBS 119687]